MQNFFDTVKKRKRFTYKCGEMFGRLTYTGVTFTRILHGHWVRFIEAVCVCGEVKEYNFSSVARGDTQSCGCFRKEVTKRNMTTHNLSNHLLYYVHDKMKDRCYNEKNAQFKDYGGRGIEVWKDWREDFVCFYDWCMANGYKEGLSLDRKENDGNYSPQNCKFSTDAEQKRNTRRNRMFTAFGETKCLFDWGKDSRCAVNVWGLRSRVDSGKWDGNFEGALTTKQDHQRDQREKKNNVFISAFGENKCMTAWLEDKRCLVKLDSLRDRYKKGWAGEKILTTPPHSSGKKGIILQK